MRKLYLYLASRSKRGIKLITTLDGNESVVRTKVNDLRTFGLPPVWQREIQQIIHENRMLYEPIIESAGSYRELRERLKLRGFSNLPMSSTQMINILKFGRPPSANVSSANANRVMLQKRKR